MPAAAGSWAACDRARHSPGTAVSSWRAGTVLLPTERDWGDARPPREQLTSAAAHTTPTATSTATLAPLEPGPMDTTPGIGPSSLGRGQRTLQVGDQVGAAGMGAEPAGRRHPVGGAASPS